jgi:hypothetical protein
MLALYAPRQRTHWRSSRRRIRSTRSWGSPEVPAPQRLQGAFSATRPHWTSRPTRCNAVPVGRRWTPRLPDAQDGDGAGRPLCYASAARIRRPWLARRCATAHTSADGDSLRRHDRQQPRRRVMRFLGSLGRTRMFRAACAALEICDNPSARRDHSGLDSTRRHRDRRGAGQRPAGVTRRSPGAGGAAAASAAAGQILMGETGALIRGQASAELIQQRADPLGASTTSRADVRPSVR